MSSQFDVSAVAKNKAIDFLEVSIETACLVLGISVDELNESYEIPVPESDSLYKSYKSLIHMYESLNKLRS